MALLEKETIVLGMLGFGLLLLSWSILRLLFLPYEDIQKSHDGKRRNTPLGHFISEEDLRRMQNGICVCCVIFGLAILVPMGKAIMGLPLCILAGFLYFAPAIYYKYKIRKRNQAFEEGMLDFILLVANGLRSGQSLTSAISLAAQSSADCIREEFSLALEEHQLGFTLRDALKRINGRISSESLKLFTTICIANEGTGGSQAEILENIIRTIRKEIAIRGRLPVLVAGQKFEANLLTLIPFLLMMVTGLFNFEVIRPFFVDGIGITALLFALLMVLGAYFLMQKITDIKI